MGRANAVGPTSIEGSFFKLRMHIVAYLLLLLYQCSLLLRNFTKLVVLEGEPDGGASASSGREGPRGTDRVHLQSDG